MSRILLIETPKPVKTLRKFQKILTNSNEISKKLKNISTGIEFHLNHHDTQNFFSILYSFVFNFSKSYSL